MGFWCNHMDTSDKFRKIKLKASELDLDYYDGKRIYGYGGFKYDGRWKKYAKKIIKRYKLTNKSKILHINCEKGFILNDINKFIFLILSADSLPLQVQPQA